VKYAKDFMNVISGSAKYGKDFMNVIALRLTG
jgi:hypothetical protein